MQVNTLVFYGSPQPFDEDVVEEPALAVNRDEYARSAQPVCRSEGRELAAQICVHDFGRADPGKSLVQCLDAEVSFQRIRGAPSQHLARVPAHDGDQIQKPAPHR